MASCQGTYILNKLHDAFATILLSPYGKSEHEMQLSSQGRLLTFGATLGHLYLRPKFGEQGF